ncbi:hypothetical protein SCP_0213800 [Sparassis crispa]|uniref:Uncharacterized protein n=1 Tax=Sparassis crispa TaxID=139825 RepID=A0A401GDC7_9APHY|nr:hypothetical protein SCP_0213800 [Sparassis crispa]GBE80172.1 hypothetical protein SCP_0213800 [Sparassis crispa]
MPTQPFSSSMFEYLVQAGQQQRESSLRVTYSFMAILEEVANATVLVLGWAGEGF